MAEPRRQPNILFVFDDQHRFDYLGCAGADFIRTPNIDRLAARGVRFTHATTNCPVCAPARIGLATGLQPCHLGSLDNNSFLPLSAATYYQRLRDSGYRVGCVGKLDLAKPDPYNGRNGDRPCVYGWGFTHPEECEGKMHAGGSPTPRGPYNYYLQQKGLLQKFYEDYQARRATGWIKNATHDSVLPTDAFEDVYIGRRATEWLERVPDDFPWHYFVSFVGPHGPFDPPTEYADRYRNATMPPAIRDSLAGKPESVRRRRLNMEADEVAVMRRQYCAAIEVIDEQVGAMLDVLERRGMLDSTYVIFSSDHGEMLGDHGLHSKSLPYEPALRVPLIVAGPRIEGGRVSDALIELIDVNPVICELAGLAPQESIDARPFGPILRGTADEHRTETVSAIRGFRLIRTHRHKLVQNYNADCELYDLAEDPDELHNIAPDNPDLVRSLGQRMNERYTERKWRG